MVNPVLANLLLAPYVSYYIIIVIRLYRMLHCTTLHLVHILASHYNDISDVQLCKYSEGEGDTPFVTQIMVAPHFLFFTFCSSVVERWCASLGAQVRILAVSFRVS